MKEQKGHTKTQITDRAKDWHLTVNPRGKKGKVITSEDKDDTICIPTKNGTENLNIYIFKYILQKSHQNEGKKCRSKGFTKFQENDTQNDQ